MTKEIITQERLKRCPLCGNRVAMTVFGELFPSTQKTETPVYKIRMTIKCPIDYLTLDLADNGWAVDADGKPEAEQHSILVGIMKVREEYARAQWNKRAGDE